jgi:N-formylglutamate amidohydrolase
MSADMGQLEEVAGWHRLSPGSPDSPVILHVPHSSTQLTDDGRRHIRLADAELAHELALLTDAHTDVIAARAAAAAAVEPHMFVNLLSRLVVDPERFPDDREEMLAAGMGAVYTRTSHGDHLRDADPSHLAHLLATYYHPYAAAMTSTVDGRLAATGRAVVIDVHSYPSRALPYELHADRPRPAICLGTDPVHTPPGLLAAARDAFASCGDPFDDVAENAPFAGCYVPLKHYGRDPAVTAIMIEIRRDAYMAEPGGEPTAGVDRVAAGLARLVDAVTRSPDRGRLLRPER